MDFDTSDAIAKLRELANRLEDNTYFLKKIETEFSRTWPSIGVGMLMLTINVGQAYKLGQDEVEF